MYNIYAYVFTIKSIPHISNSLFAYLSLYIYIYMIQCLSIYIYMLSPHTVTGIYQEIYAFLTICFGGSNLSGGQRQRVALARFFFGSQKY